MRAVLTDLLERHLSEAAHGRGCRPCLARRGGGRSCRGGGRDSRRGRYDVGVETAVYFCCLEAVQNAGKHAGAKRVIIDLREEPEGLVLTVEDDGKGFGEQPPRPGVGLANMRDRIEALGGTLLLRDGCHGRRPAASPRAAQNAGRASGPLAAELPQSRVP